MIIREMKIDFSLKGFNPFTAISRKTFLDIGFFGYWILDIMSFTPNWKIGSIERQQFYLEAKETFAVITTSDTRPYGCFIFTKGVLKPDGSVWMI